MRETIGVPLNIPELATTWHRNGFFHSLYIVAKTESA
jgi:hypothetical protein